MSVNHPHILVFDSGVGGLSIVEHIRKLTPGVTITYLADNAWFPYGTLNNEELVERVVELLTESSLQCQPDMMVIACNTASTLVLARLRQQLSIPIVGVVPAIKPASIQSTSKVIGLLATPATVQRDYTDTLINDFAKDCEIIRCGSAALVDLAEQKLSGKPQPQDDYHTILAPLFAHPRGHEMDTVILACTHFPFVKHELAAAAPNVSVWLDSGQAIAQRIKSLLLSQPIPLPDTPLRTAAPWADKALFTNIALLNTALRKNLPSFGFNQVEQFQGDFSSPSTESLSSSDLQL